MSRQSSALKIAICVHGEDPTRFFGTAVYALQLAQGLLALGHTPEIVTTRFDGETAGGGEEVLLADPDLNSGIPIHRVIRPSVRGVRDTYLDERLAPTIAACFNRIRPDVVHVAHYLNLTAILFDVARDMRLPTFATLTDFHGVCHRGTLLNSWNRSCRGPNSWRTNCLECGLRDRAAERSDSLGLAYLASHFARPTTALVLRTLTNLMPPSAAKDIRAVIDRPDALRRRLSSVRGVLAPSRYLRDIYQRNGFKLPITISRFGIDADRSARVLRPNGPLRVGFIGQISPHKGCHVLVEAARAMLGEEVVFTIYGDQERHPRYAAELVRRSVGTRVTFRGAFPITEMNSVLREIDVLVLPSLWAENSPLTMLQALAAHTPVIAARQPGTAEFIEEGVNGFLTRPGSARDVARVLRRLARDRDLVNRLMQAAHYPRTPIDMARDALALYADHGIR